VHADRHELAAARVVVTFDDVMIAHADCVEPGGDLE